MSARKVSHQILIMLAALITPILLLVAPASATQTAPAARTAGAVADDSAPLEGIFWSGLQGANGVVSQDALVADSDKPFPYLGGGQQVDGAAWLGPMFEPAPAGTASMYWQINCTTSSGLQQVYQSTPETITIPGSSNNWEAPPVPTLFVSRTLTIPSTCIGSGDATVDNPDGWVYICVTDQDPPDANNATYCDSTAFGMLAPGDTPPGGPFPTGTTTVYRWVSPSELSDIQATGHFDPAPNGVASWFFGTYQDAEAVKSLYDGYTLVSASMKSGSVIDYSVGVTGLANVNAWLIPQEVMDALYDVAEVAGG